MRKSLANGLLLFSSAQRTMEAQRSVRARSLRRFALVIVDTA